MVCPVVEGGEERFGHSAGRDPFSQVFGRVVAEDVDPVVAEHLRIGPFTTDGELEVEEAFVCRGRRLPQADLVQPPHHVQIRFRLVDLCRQLTRFGNRGQPALGLDKERVGGFEPIAVPQLGGAGKSDVDVFSGLFGADCRGSSFGDLVPIVPQRCCPAAEDQKENRAGQRQCDPAFRSLHAGSLLFFHGPRFSGGAVGLLFLQSLLHALDVTADRVGDDRAVDRAVNRLGGETSLTEVDQFAVGTTFIESMERVRKIRSKHPFPDLIAGVEPFAGEDLAQNRTQSEHVGSGIELVDFAARLFGGHVSRRPQDSSGLREHRRRRCGGLQDRKGIGVARRSPRMAGVDHRSRHD